MIKPKSLKKSKKLLEKVLNILFDLFFFVLALFLAIFLGIASEPLIYLLNQPLGLFYARVGSYGVAICLFIIFRGAIELSLGEKK